MVPKSFGIENYFWVKNILVPNFVGQFVDRKRDWISKFVWDQYFWDLKKFELNFCSYKKLLGEQLLIQEIEYPIF